MDGNITYHPNRVYKCFAPAMLVCAVVFWVLLGGLLNAPQYSEAVIVLIMAVITTVLQRYLYRLAAVSVILEPEGLRILNDGKTTCRFLPWEALHWGGYARSFRGHLFLILSGEVLDEKQAKHLADRGANQSRIWLGDAAVIWLDNLQDTTEMEQVLAQKICGFRKQSVN